MNKFDCTALSSITKFMATARWTISSLLTTMTPTSSSQVSTVIAFLKHNFLIATIPFFVDGSFTTYKLINALAFIVGMECWNQMSSEQEDLISNRKRPKIQNKSYLILTWILCLAIGTPIVKLWCIISAIVYSPLANNASSPWKELHMVVGVAVHFSFLNISLHPTTLIRHALMLCIQDVPDVKADSAVCRMTLPILFGGKEQQYRYGFQIFYGCLALYFGMTGIAPLLVSLTYVCIAIFCQQHPVKCYKLWKIMYIIELFCCCHRISIL